MGLFDWALNSDSKEEKKTVTKTTVTEKKTTTTPVTMTTTYTTPVAGAEQPKYVEYFDKTFAERNFPGPDYYEFMKAIRDNIAAGLAVDEKTLFVLTYNGLKAQGCDKLKLVDTSGKYLEMFAEKLKGFNSDVEKTFKSEIGSRQLRLAEIENDNKAIDAEMLKLAERKQKNIEQLGVVNGEITAKTNSLNTEKASFEMTYNRVTKEIHDNLQKINTYIP